jgi:Flp pilus assembly protein TadD
VKRSKADRMAVENLIASALADFACASTGLPGFGNADSAEESLLEVLRVDPGNLEAMNLLAQTCAQTGRHNEAWSYFLKGIIAARKKDDAVKLACALAEIYEKRKAYRRAIRVYREALTRHEDPHLHLGLGYCFGKLSRFAESVRHHQRAAELAPRDAKVLSDLGYSLMEMNQLQEAESTLLRAVELDPKDELARGNLEHCLKLLAKDGGR